MQQFESIPDYDCGGILDDPLSCCGERTYKLKNPGPLSTFLSFDEQSRSLGLLCTDRSYVGNHTVEIDVGLKEYAFVPDLVPKQTLSFNIEIVPCIVTDLTSIG